MRQLPEFCRMELSVILPRLSVSRLSLALLVAAQMFGLAAYVLAGEPAESVEPPSPRPGAVRRALREFDRFLAHHPLLEDKLRCNPPLTTNAAFLKSNPDLREFLRVNPNVEAGLKIYPRYFLNRGLLHQASTPLSFKELVPFYDLFLQQPEIQHELTENPELIRVPAFQEAHPALRNVLLEHTALAQAYLISTVSANHQ